MPGLTQLLRGRHPIRLAEIARSSLGALIGIPVVTLTH